MPRILFSKLCDILANVIRGSQIFSSEKWK